MGLERHVDAVIATRSPELRGAYRWHNGLRVTDPDATAALLETLNGSGEFGTAYDDGGVIKFGLFRDYLPETPTRIWVPADYRTWFERGDPPVAHFTVGTEVALAGKHSEHWLRAPAVPGFPPGRTVLFSTEDIGKTLVVLE